MKTQISNLISGSPFVMRDKQHPKYHNCELNSTIVSPEGERVPAGTPTAERMRIAEAVKAENGDIMLIDVRGIQLEAIRQASKTGKTVWYEAQLTEEQYFTIIGQEKQDQMTRERLYTLIMQPNMEVHLNSQVLKRGSWSFNGATYIDEAFVTIR